MNDPHPLPWSADPNRTPSDGICIIDANKRLVCIVDQDMVLRILVSANLAPTLAANCKALIQAFEAGAIELTEDNRVLLAENRKFCENVTEVIGPPVISDLPDDVLPEPTHEGIYHA